MKHTEGSVTISTTTPKVVTKDMGVFFNPVMQTNRDISVALLQQTKGGKIADVLAASGIRGLRIAKEVKNVDVYINDRDKKSFLEIKKNAKANKVKIKASNEEANEFLRQGFDYVDIDPFGSPNPFLDAAVRSTKNKGILAITATDTAPLSGTYPKTCQRKYWATPVKNWQMHETGIRILTRKVQLVAAQFDKAMTPIYAHSSDHYFRIYFRCERGKEKVDKVLKQHGMLGEAGPLWLGKLWDATLAKKIAKVLDTTMTNTIADEAKLNAVGFYDTHVLAKQLKVALPKMDAILKTLRKKGHKATRTHFSGYGLRTDADEKAVKKSMK
ncbi:MAG: tRNA (guanine(26)-N(2))-dimethyltransferase [Candidatus Woesearchaeota archaeon]|jgi:tRNA (guanine26-N2/guanine27-N2)-dimethyltransferase|nr:tRNA (guanine(26)-N(2))-dimethyltransferase [Candidatus Woesearchaeota archaeon]MDP7199233.1 tRNA (guanine(26)-N(2))-dimethyltransferase [Candidatus Woesearchaeota archaeon]MDP7467846.1 tRNA (guanine(26)-N(2))-dimethyltransferase [Candidatus Woesearchaeota archaeon]MDP7647836.1 tRNA (guanine(26)-N(2))-dimethyltransferase [Candidatus Woesearchaeota archaeon]